MTVPGMTSATNPMFAPANLVAVSRERRTKYRETERMLVAAVAQDPEVEHPTNLSVFIREESGDGEIHLIGKVASSREYERVQEIIQNNTPDDMSLVNEMIVDDE